MKTKGRAPATVWFRHDFPFLNSRADSKRAFLIALLFWRSECGQRWRRGVKRSTLTARASHTIKARGTLGFCKCVYVRDGKFSAFDKDAFVNDCNFDESAT